MWRQLGWAPCSICGWWELNPRSPDYSGFPCRPWWNARLFCDRCWTEFVEGRLQHCFLCGWWDWGYSDDSPVCAYCLRAMARRMRLAFPTLPESVCARIVYWELYIDEDSLLRNASTDDLSDRVRE